MPRATYYRNMDNVMNPLIQSDARPTPPLALSLKERQTVIDVLHSERFQNKTPYETYATLLDEGMYYCSIRTMYRMLNAEHGDVKERRKGHLRTHYKKPELLATDPNQVWSWDITKLKGPVKWTYYH